MRPVKGSIYFLCISSRSSIKEPKLILSLGLISPTNGNNPKCLDCLTVLAIFLCTLVFSLVWYLLYNFPVSCMNFESKAVLRYVMSSLLMPLRRNFFLSCPLDRGLFMNAAGFSSTQYHYYKVDHTFIVQLSLSAFNQLVVIKECFRVENRVFISVLLLVLPPGCHGRLLVARLKFIVLLIESSGWIWANVLPQCFFNHRFHCK